MVDLVSLVIFISEGAVDAVSTSQTWDESDRDYAYDEVVSLVFFMHMLPINSKLLVAHLAEIVTWFK